MTENSHEAAGTGTGTISRRFFSSIVSLLHPAHNGSATSLNSRRPSAHISTLNEKPSSAEDAGQDPNDAARLRAEEQAEAHEDNIDRRRHLNTVPPWVHSLQEGESTEEAGPHAHLLPADPSAVRYPHHNHMPIPKPRPDGVAPEMAERFRDAMNRPGLSIETASRWQAFARSSAFPRVGGEIVSPEWLEENMPDLDTLSTRDDSDKVAPDGWLWFLNAKKRSAAGERWNVSCYRIAEAAHKH